MISYLIAVIALISEPSILFVGNSYTAANGGIFNYVQQIYDSVEPDSLNAEGHTVGGATFGNHWHNPDVIDELESGDWDKVVFQEYSCMPVIDPSMMYLYGDSLAWFATMNGTEPVFFMTWARKKDPLMLEGLQLGYSRMGHVHNSLVAPCGIAFDYIRRIFPQINPYSSDGTHPSQRGTYLAACVMALTIYDVDLLSDDIWQPVEISVNDGIVLRSAAIWACSTYIQPSAVILR